jgi:hypothetical protein
MKRKTGIKLPLQSVLIVTALWIAGCAEEFPPYQEPKDVLVGELTVSTADTVEGYYDDGFKTYFLNTPIIMGVKLRNTYDNLLQGAAKIRGQTVVQTFSQVPRVCVVPLSLGDLRSPPVFQGNLAIPPGAAADFSFIWLPIATDNKYVFEGVPYTLIDKVRTYSPIAFVANAEVQVFERVQAIKFGGLGFTVVFKITEP